MNEVRIKQETTEYKGAELFAALKLIEQLYIDGYILKHIFQNICDEYHSKCA